MIEEIAIVAGGRGIRLKDVQTETPKTLIKVGDQTILDLILTTINHATKGNFRLLIAAGIHFGMLKEYVEVRSGPYVKVEVLEATEWEQGNAATLLAADGYINNETFILQMSDHLFSPQTYKRCVEPARVPDPFVCGQPRSDDIPPYLDLADATKVLVDDEHRVLEIGKEIPEWNRIDMGIFRLNCEAFRVIERLPRNEKSLSNYVSAWRNRAPFYVNSLPGAIWKDIDTKQDLDWARQLGDEEFWRT